MQASELLKYLKPRSEIEVVCISQNELIPYFLNLVMVNALYGTVGTHRHECGCFNPAMGQVDISQSCLCFLIPQDFGEYPFSHVHLRLPSR